MSDSFSFLLQNKIISLLFFHSNRSAIFVFLFFHFIERLNRWSLVRIILPSKMCMRAHSFTIHTLWALSTTYRSVSYAKEISSFFGIPCHSYRVYDVVRMHQCMQPFYCMRRRKKIVGIYTELNGAYNASKFTNAKPCLSGHNWARWQLVCIKSDHLLT